jgi:sulfate adenylyltransferase subunit 2
VPASVAVPSLRSLTHLRALEAEAIYILRETAAQFERPVLLYSIGKDSSVMLHLARKAFFPCRIPFPLMHIDTGFEYPEMIAFRDWFVTELGAHLITHTNRAAVANRANPYDIGTARCCGLLRTQAG